MAQTQKLCFNNYKDIIDKLVENKIDNSRTENGMGRTVYLFDTYVIKVSRNLGENKMCGEQQCKTEYRVWESSKSDILCPVLYYHRNCVVMPLLETNPDIILELLGLKDLEEFREYLGKHKFEEVSKLSLTHNLNFKDLWCINNWGYDYKTDEIKIIDYGLSC